MVSANRYMHNMWKNFTKLSPWTHLLFLLMVACIVIYIVNRNNAVVEGFVQKENYMLKKGTDIYDDFYATYYDKLLYSRLKNSFEIGEIMNLIPLDENSQILDVGSGTGHHVDAFTQAIAYNTSKGTKEGFTSSAPSGNPGPSGNPAPSGPNKLSPAAVMAAKSQVTGIDKSSAMVAKASETYPDNQYKNLDALDSMAFPTESFTLITCLYFTIYYMKRKDIFFENCFNWLKPGGNLIIHLVDKHKFSPIVETADILQGISPQTYTDKRLTNSEVIFNSCNYKADFKLKNDNDNTAILTETFNNKKTGQIRQNEHNLYMESQKEILAQARTAGFILVSKIDMATCQYDYQYLYVLQKPQ